MESQTQGAASHLWAPLRATHLFSELLVRSLSRRFPQEHPPLGFQWVRVAHHSPLAKIILAAALLATHTLLGAWFRSIPTSVEFHAHKLKTYLHYRRSLREGQGYSQFLQTVYPEAAV